MRGSFVYNTQVSYYPRLPAKFLRFTILILRHSQTLRYFTPVSSSTAQTTRFSQYSQWIKAETCETYNESIDIGSACQSTFGFSSLANGYILFYILLFYILL